MTELHRRLLEDLPLRNYSPRTQAAYVAQVAQFARHFGRSPDQLEAEEVRAYQLHLIHERKWLWSSFNQAVTALRFFTRCGIAQTPPVADHALRGGTAVAERNAPPRERR